MPSIHLLTSVKAILIKAKLRLLQYNLNVVQLLPGGWLISLENSAYQVISNGHSTVTVARK